MNLYSIPDEITGCKGLEPGMVVRVIMNSDGLDYTQRFVDHCEAGGTFIVAVVDEKDDTLPVYVKWHQVTSMLLDDDGLGYYGEWMTRDARYEIVGQV